MSELHAEIYDRNDLRNIIAELGVDLKRINSKYSRCSCFFHNDTKTPNMFVWRGFYKCYACGAKGNTLEFIMNYYNVSAKEAVKRLVANNNKWKSSTPNKLRPSQRNKKEYVPIDKLNEVLSFILASCNTKVKDVKFLRDRKISLKTIKQMNIQYMGDPSAIFTKLKHQFDNKLLRKMNIMNDRGNFMHFHHRLLFPYYLGKKVVFMQSRTNQKGGVKHLPMGDRVVCPYNWSSLKKGYKRVLIAEGVTDALALIENYKDSAVISVPGVMHMKDEWVEKLKDKEIVVAFDNDEGGERGFEFVKEKFKEYNTVIKRGRLPEGVKDYSEYHKLKK